MTQYSMLKRLSVVPAFCSSVAPSFLLPTTIHLSIAVRAPRLMLVIISGAFGLSGGPNGGSWKEWKEFRARLAGTTKGSTGSSANQAALRNLDERLWKEYSEGIWAHPTSLIEPGNLLCALPIQGQLIQELRLKRPDVSPWPASLHERLMDESTSGFMARWLGVGAEPDPTALAFAWKSASTMCNEGLSNMCGGIPSAAERKLWSLQCSALERRGQVCLVLAEDSGDTDKNDEEQDEEAAAVAATKAASEAHASSFRCLVQSKQLASSVTPDLARRLLMGRRDAWQASSADVALVLEAFGSSTVYYGGPEDESGSAQLVHGRDDLEGLPSIREISSGTRLYHGAGADSLKEAALAVIDGRAQPLDFRLTIGSTRLAAWQAKCEWSSVACSRVLALKPSPKGLPKPLWNEIMEVAGGEYAEISRLVTDETSSGKPRNPNRPRGDSDI